MSVEAPGRRIAPGRNIALVLGAGGARGIAHVGVIQALEARGYRIAGIAGASMGSLVGGIYAAGRLNEYSEWARGLQRGDVLRLLDFAFGYPGLIRGERVIGALRELVGEHLIEELPIPYVAVATDLVRQREVWLTRGKLFDAIRASIAIPMVFTPHEFDGRELVDGGLLSPVPIAATRAMRADRVIAVDVNGPVSWLNAGLEPRHEEMAAGHGIDEAPGHGGGARQQLQEVERRALGREQHACARDDLAQQLPGLDRVAVLHVPVHHRGGAQRGEGGVEPGGATDDRVLAGNDAAAGLGVGGDQAGGEIAGADVLGERGCDVALDFDAELFGEHGRTWKFGQGGRGHG